MRQASEKIVTLSKPPSPDFPYLQKNRHQKIIDCFTNRETACYTLNSSGNVDFYLLIPEEYVEAILEKDESFDLKYIHSEEVRLILHYDDFVSAEYKFTFQDAMDFYSLKRIVQKRVFNIYYINYLDGEYVCTGVKMINISGIFAYNLGRVLQGKKPLSFPRFSEESASDREITEAVLHGKAWGYYIDYSVLINQVGDFEEAEEIVSRHILHGMTRLQKSRRPSIKDEKYILWVGRNISLDEKKEPSEFYNVYISSKSFTGSLKDDLAGRIFKEALIEVPGYSEEKWTYPLAQEGMPVVMLHKGSIRRFKLTERFFQKSVKAYQKLVQPQTHYQSYYEKVLQANSFRDSQAEVYDFSAIREEKKNGLKEAVVSTDSSLDELVILINSGEEKYLPIIFENIIHIDSEDLDELMVLLYERYKEKVEPYLLPLIYSEYAHIKEAALLGLGMIESYAVIPELISRLCAAKKEAELAKNTLVLIGVKALPFLKELLKDKRAEIRIRALETLALYGGHEVLTIIQGMKKDRSKRVEEVKNRIIKDINW